MNIDAKILSKQIQQNTLKGHIPIIKWDLS